MSGIVECPDCGGKFTVEEYPSHNCSRLRLVVFDTNGNRWGSYNGNEMFKLPRFPPTELKQPNKTELSLKQNPSDGTLQRNYSDDNLTEPGASHNSRKQQESKSHVEPTACSPLPAC